MNTTNSPSQLPATVLPAPPRPSRWPTLLLAGVIFVGGFVAGAGMAVVVIVNRVQYAIHHPYQAPRRITKVLRKRLRLNNRQAREVQAILTRRQEALMAIRREVHPRVTAELERTHRQIEAVLNERQKRKWRRLFNQLRARWFPQPPPPRTRPARK